MAARWWKRWRPGPSDDDLLRRAGGVVDDAVLVQAICNQSRYLSETGRRQAALGLAEEAVDRVRELYTIDRSRIQLLAEALLTVAKRPMESGRPQEALACSREAVELTDVRSDAALAEQLGTLALSLAAMRSCCTSRPGDWIRRAGRQTP